MAISYLFQLMFSLRLFKYVIIGFIFKFIISSILLCVDENISDVFIIYIYIYVNT